MIWMEGDEVMERSNIYTFVQNLFHRTWKWTSRRYQYGQEDPILRFHVSLLGNTSWAWTGQSELIKLVYFWSGSMVCVFLYLILRSFFCCTCCQKKWMPNNLSFGRFIGVHSDVLFRYYIVDKFYHHFDGFPNKLATNKISLPMSFDLPFWKRMRIYSWGTCPSLSRIQIFR